MVSAVAGSASPTTYRYAGTTQDELVHQDLTSGSTIDYVYGRTDSNGQQQGNRYAYAADNPINYVDPTGRSISGDIVADYTTYALGSTICVAIGIGTGVVGGIICELVVFGLSEA